MLNIVIFGAPGSGKGTQSELLIERYGLYHISTGEVLRAEIAKGSELGKTAESYISKGCLIPDELMIDVLANVLDSNKEQTSKGVIFDGFPRTIPQAVALKEMLAKRGTEVHAVVGLEVADEELIERLIKRGQESGRADDNLETIKNRLQVYHNQTSPLKQHYTTEGNYYAFEGVGAVESIFANIAKTLDKLV
jgi:adenylate kinase